MSNDLTKMDRFDAGQIELLKTQICKGATTAELALFIEVCKRTELDPFAKQIYAIQRSGKMTIQVSIDGARVVAERSGHYLGQQGPFWCGKDGAWRDVWLLPEPPMAAKVGVWKKGATEPIWGVANFSAYAVDGPMWKKMPANMIAKCAESLALRKAFPMDLSGLYTQEEMDQEEGDKNSTSVAETNSRFVSESNARLVGPAAAEPVVEPTVEPSPKHETANPNRVGGDYVIKAGHYTNKRLDSILPGELGLYRDELKQKIPTADLLNQAKMMDICDAIDVYLGKK